MSRQRDLLMDVFLACPYPLSKWVYRLGRRAVRKNPRRELFELAFRTAAEKGIDGDYLEFGVYRGSTFVCAFEVAQRQHRDNMRFFAFDCFEGLPDGEGDVFEAGAFAFPEHMFRKVIRKAGVAPDRTVVVKGLYNESLNETTKRDTGLKRAAIVLVDCDIYSSTKDVLAFIEDLIGLGTVLMFDDWYDFGPEPEAHGEAKAFGEWRLKDCFDELYDCPGPGMTGKGFVMARTPSS